MSLVVARATHDELVMVADTLVSYENTREICRGLREDEGALKIFPLSETRSLGFAGDVRIARDIYREMFLVGNAQFYLFEEEIAEELLQHHKQCGYSVDFLLGSLFPSPIIYTIKNGEIEKSKVGWLGNQRAFSAFQEQSASIDGSTLAGRLSQSMITIIQQGNFADVGGIPSCLLTLEGGFMYRKLVIYIPSFPIGIKGKGRIESSSTTGADYEIEIMRSVYYGHPVMIVYYRSGNMGLLFSPTETTAVTAPTTGLFLQKMKEVHNIEIDHLPFFVLGKQIYKDGSEVPEFW